MEKNKSNSKSKVTNTKKTQSSVSSKTSRATTKKKVAVSKTDTKTKKSNKKKNKALTLIELLAVIIILGVLMIIAIPSVTTYISNSRKSAYIDSARAAVASVRNSVNEGKIPLYDTDVTYYYDSQCIKSENTLRSPYGDFDPAYVLVTYNGDGYDYYWTSRDTTGQGVRNIVKYEHLTEDDIVSGISAGDITPNVGIGTRSKIILIDSNCNPQDELLAVNHVSEGGGERPASQGGNGETPTPGAICKRATELHLSEMCEGYSDDYINEYKDYCYYGNVTTTSGALNTGDAFDCDVNNDGVYDSNNERFYYMSSSYDGTTASLMYSKNLGDGFVYSGRKMAYVNSVSSWTNPKLLTIPNKSASSVDGGPIYYVDDGNFLFIQYSGRTRLLDFMDLDSCNISISNSVYLQENVFGYISYFSHHNKCDFLYENLVNCYSTQNFKSVVNDNIAICNDSGESMYIDYYNRNSDSSNVKSRPVIEVLKTDMTY